MTTDKLPDVVWISPAVRWSYEDDYDAAGPGAMPYFPKAALDAMTAERDALAEQVILRDGTIQTLEAQRNTLMERHKARVDERDSAREALAKATELLRGMKHVAECEGWHMAHADEVEDMRDFLAAQPETKT